MKFDGNCLLPSNLQNVKKAQFFIAGAEKEIRLVFANFKKLTVDLNPSEKLKKKSISSFFLDDIKLDYFSRNRDWIHSADLRIDDLRTMDFRLSAEDLEGVDRLEITMLESDFIWGGMFDQYMPKGPVSLVACELNFRLLK